MVFKKPYAILIKHFKLIHILLTLLMAYSIYKMTRIISFFNEYISSGWKSINNEEISAYIGPLVYISIIFIIIISIIVYLLMRFKKKPRMYYLLTPLLYIIVFIITVVAGSILETATTDVISPIVTRAIRDVLLIFTAFQFVFIIFSLLRAIGFDVKKFNFKKDIADLEISEKDNEEVEVGFEIEKYKYSRKINRRLRNIKYIFLEHKFIWISIFSVIIVSIVVYAITNIFFTNKIYKQNNVVSLGQYNMIVRGSYMTTTDTKNNEISDEYKYIIVDTVINSSIEKNTFNIDALSLENNKEIYYPYTKGYSKFKDYGIGYKEGEVLNTNMQNQYIFVFRIPKDVNIKDTYLRYLYNTEYKDGISTNQHKKIKLNISSDNSKKVENKLNEEMQIGNNKLSISSYEFNNQYTYTYKFCYEDNNCTDSKGLVNTSFGANKTIMKINLKYETDENDTTLSYENMGDFFEEVSTIKYEKNGKYYIQKNIENLTPDEVNENEIYLEVSNNIKDSDYISLEFKNKGISYSYVLKGE